MSDIEGKAARVAASELGQRASFKTISDSAQRNLGWRLFASLCVGNALTTIPPLRYAHRYDYQIFYPHFFNRLWQPLRCARSIPQPERVACCIALTG